MPGLVGVSRPPGMNVRRPRTRLMCGQFFRAQRANKTSAQHSRMGTVPPSAFVLVEHASGMQRELMLLLSSAN